MRCSFCLLALLTAFASADEPLLKPGDRVAILGGTFVERMQSSGALEAELQCRRPQWKLSFRNLGWSGDDVSGIARKRFDGPEDGYQRILADVQTADPTVVIVAYGFSEASDGSAAVDRFDSSLRRLVGDLQNMGHRVILMPPVAMPGYKIPHYEQAIDRCRRIVADVGSQTAASVLAPQWRPSEDQVTADGLVPNENGYARLADKLGDALVGGKSCDDDNQELRELVIRKNELFFHRYRPQNETYLLLFRKHEQGNNAVEIEEFDPLIQAADQAIWDWE